MLRVEGVSYKYISESRHNAALTNVIFDVDEGEFVAIIGTNGSGKSTLAKHLNALLLPTTGKVYVDDMDTSV
ncbi:MAG: ATP-binding cassette domain-containing protein, partial [Selenomonadaceae bacterium]|nr:ATP-binding cassette domain-containing protein [Selenomonadaceae bacterium]